MRIGITKGGVVSADKELWLCRSYRTNHLVVGWGEGPRGLTLCNLEWVTAGGVMWSDADQSKPLCIRCRDAAEKRFRKTRPREHYEPNFLKASNNK